ncbi:helix-turn-helix transcriptional regulator [Lentibacter sp. XHP0401]|uniref:helix-turn-helix transcriptional regulator n=1 Tax=Lentibacter sp. XHP0401 TaxID=2984334 RepID=UPI0021E7AE75|nr:helix-turn-helix transcriptional regulator [Lentibacter sp. XHP0401]MCV2892945.1 helix-turn-helix transcriptional regulator [Lentibacter sp. XHP0401]
MPINKMSRFPLGLFLLMVVQFFCAVFFIGDVVADYRAMGGLTGGIHFWVEVFATVSLFVTIAFEAKFLLRLLRREAHLQDRLRLASAAVYDVIEAQFDEWALSPAEVDVATFLVKGLDIAEIAHVRGCAEGTVKAHLNAIYRKSGTHSRGELLSVVIDVLLGQEAAGSGTAG